jgi:hypothetical protein
LFEIVFFGLLAPLVLALQSKLVRERGRILPGTSWQQLDAGSYAVHSHHHTHLGKSSDEIADFVGVEFDLQPANS